MTLSERLGGNVVPGGSGRSAGIAGARLHKWRERVAGGNDARFEKRLRWDGLDVDSALGLLGPVRLKDPYRLPEWVGLLDAAAGTESDDMPPVQAVTPRHVFDPRDPQPFEELLWPLIREAIEGMLPRLGTCRDRLSRAALADLARGLLARLCRTAARTLAVEFDAYRALHSGCFRLDGRENRRGPSLDRDFVRDMSGEGLAGWLLRYPMLGRLLATCCRQWMASTVDLVRRLDRDAGALRATFGFEERSLEIAGVTPYLSDPHRDGRTVCAIRFHSGASVAYKPRPLALEHRFSNLLERIDGMGHDLTLKRPRVLDRGDYGWMEWMEAVPCADPAAVERFYRRAGMLTCLAHVLGASDLHAANLIASGDHPVPIDLECLVGAPLANPSRNAADPAHLASPPGSVLRTGLPPAARSGIDGAFRIGGGLAAGGARPAEGAPDAGLNTDRTAWRGLAGGRGSELNVPVLDGRRRVASACMEPLLDGFRLMYRTLSRNRGRLTTAAAVHRLEHEEFRVLIRDTRSYAALLDRALWPQNVTSGPDWSIALDVLAAPTLVADERPRCWATRTAERVELERLDVPLFFGRLDDPVLRSSSGVRLDERLDPTGYAVSMRLGLLNPDDLEQQLHLLRMSFAIAEVKRRHRHRRVRAARRHDPPGFRKRLLAEVDSIVALLKRLAVGEESAATWRGLGAPGAGSARLDPLGFDLFGGTSGIALFLATTAAITGRRDARDLATRVFDPLCERLGDQRRFSADLASAIGIGGATGLGGLVYALVHAGRSLGRPDYLAAASAAADGITRNAIRADDALDVLSGAAGALLGLLALHRATGDRSSLRTAIRCGEHILDNRTTDPDTGLRTWRTSGGRMTTGFAHGPSGIGCALHRLANLTDMDGFRLAATEGWEAEQRQLAHCVPRSARCSTTRGVETRPWSWCTGAAGMGLARIDALADGNVRSAMERALRTFPSRGTAEADGLCCGRLGRADFLISAGLRLGRRDLCEAAETLCSETVTRALVEGRYATGADEGFRPGLFQGASGIGYELLRVQAPTAVPSVLLWE